MCLFPFCCLPHFSTNWLDIKIIGKKLGPLGEASILGMECITRLLENMFVEPLAMDERQTADVPVLRKNDDFVYYVTTVAHVSLSQVGLYPCSRTLGPFVRWRRI